MQPMPLPATDPAVARTARLLGEQQAEREIAAARLDRCLSEYEELAATLETLPERVERPMLVPFGKLALFEGSLRHTNEVTVLLGENYFALRSAAQAVGVARRRAEFVREQLHSVRDEVEELKRRRSMIGALDSPLIAGPREGEVIGAPCPVILHRALPRLAPRGRWRYARST